MDRASVAAILLLSFTSGCSLLKSHYAMDDPVYAEKYADGAARWDLPGKAKQMLDARHTEGLLGYYASAGGQFRPESGGGLGGVELGAEFYTKSWLTHRLALQGFAGMDDGLGAVDLGLRIQPPSRLAPFLGVGTFHGVSRRLSPANRDGRDNDDDGFIDEYGERKTSIDGWLSAVYPEAGTHFWINGRCRLTAYGRYLLTSEGRDSDEWLIGTQLAVFTR